MSLNMLVVKLKMCYKLTHLFMVRKLSMVGIFLMSIPAWGSEAADDVPETLEGAPLVLEEGSSQLRYRDPMAEMVMRYRQPVEMAIRPEWELSPEQVYTASQPPYGIVKDGRVVRYVYPEDEEPTLQQLAEGAALTAKQRKLMRRARRAALREAAWQAKVAAERFNRENAAALASAEKKERHIVIYLGNQQGVLMDGVVLLRSFRVCSGKKSTPTPKGHFHVMEKDRTHTSNLYHSSMPYFMRLTLDGVGLHQGPMRSRPSSHGCIRLHAEDARFLFENSEVGTAVFVVD